MNRYRKVEYPDRPCEYSGCTEILINPWKKQKYCETHKKLVIEENAVKWHNIFKERRKLSGESIIKKKVGRKKLSEVELQKREELKKIDEAAKVKAERKRGRNMDVYNLKTKIKYSGNYFSDIRF